MTQTSLGPLRHVALVVTGLGRGGAEVQVVSLAEGLRRRGWRVTLVSLQPPLDFADRLRDGGIAVEVIDMRGILALLAAPGRWMRLIRRIRPDVMHTHMVHANLFARVMRPLAPVPRLLCTAHSSFEGGRVREIAYRITDRLADLTTQVSHHGLERYAAIGAVSRARLRYVPNGTLLRSVEFSRTTTGPAPGQPFEWLAVGRLVAAKDYPTLLEAVARVRTLGTAMHLRIAGDGPLRGMLEARAHDLGITDSVEFLGQRDDVPALLHAAHGYVLSSSWEGLPVAVLEAGAFKLPVVATSVGGLPEVIEDQVTGRLVPPGDPVTMAAALNEVMHMTAAERDALGERLGSRVRRRYDLERVLDTWESLYREETR
ncbi:MAG: glycosyltransferase [Gemmatimonadota bacterium]